MTTDNQQPDLVTEARELFASYGRGNRSIDMTTKAFLFLRRLADEVERLRLQVEAQTNTHIRNLLKDEDND